MAGKEGAGAPQALGRSRGGFGTKIHLAAADERRAVAMTLTPGQRGDAAAFPEVLGAVPAGCRAKRALADRAFDSNEIRGLLAERRIEAVIPSNPSRKQEIPYKKRVYRRRNRVERLVGKLKQFRRVATRYDKLAITFQAFIHVAVALIAIR